VPSQIESHTFWNRYFFRVHIKEKEKLINISSAENNLSLKLGEKKHGKPPLFDLSSLFNYVVLIARLFLRLL
jgi:hypothetical protein